MKDYSRNFDENELVPTEIAENIREGQMTLFGEKTEKKLSGETKRKNEMLSCPYCGFYGKRSNLKKTMLIISGEQRIKILCEIQSVKELLSMEWLCGEVDFAKGILYESLTFDFCSGKISVGLEVEEIGAIAKKEIFSEADLENDEPILKALLSKTCSMLFRQRFEKICGFAVPFGENETELESYILMTKFRGYSRDFYDAVPILRQKRRGFDIIEESFKDAAKRLHFASDVPEIYKESALPKLKSVRKLFFEHPEFLFYRDESEKLWKAIPDPNLFCRLLSGKCGFRILALLHCFENAADYLSMLKNVQGGVSLCKALEKNPDEVFFFALRYCAMGEKAKEAEAKRRKKEKFGGMKFRPYTAAFEYDDTISFSVPMNKAEDIEAEICGFEFRILRSSAEYSKAAAELNNCLSEYCWGDNPVLAIKKGKRTVAAVEINEKMIYQVKLKNNEEINTDENLYSVFKKWLAEKNLSFMPDMDFE